MIKTIYSVVLFLMISAQLIAQNGMLKGIVKVDEEPMGFVNVVLIDTEFGTVTTESGQFYFENIPVGNYTLKASFVGFKPFFQRIEIKSNQELLIDILLEEDAQALDDVVVSGTMKEVSRLESPVPVEVYTGAFFKANPAPSVFESMQNVNGVRPQLNCNVCNTGDIHINGLEGPYTMVLIDGMPIVSGLSTVYGLTGIPQALIERVEVVKGPASTLYGSEAVGGLINLITKNAENAPVLSADMFATSWGEVNTDIGVKLKSGAKASSLLGLDYFNYQNPIDNNEDGFTDVTQQNRLSVFNKWNFERRENRMFSLAGRYVYEDRWGGEMDWTTKNRGGNEVYGESIYTSRWEVFGLYQLPFKEKVNFQFSANQHIQNSVYGNVKYLADQFIGFGQLTWDSSIKNHELLIGAAYRFTAYDDNTPATSSADNIRNQPSITHLPGIFLQDQISLNPQNKLLFGLRYDYNSRHDSILSPRLNYKWNSKSKTDVLRLSIGNGYRVANVFTEDHAALSGGREVVFVEALKPETSWNTNVNYVKKFITADNIFVDLDATAFYTRFQNRIVADYDTNPNQIIYDNLNGYAISQGISLNVDVSFPSSLKLLVGATVQDVFLQEEGVRKDQLLTEQFSAVWNVSYTFLITGIKVDYTGNLYGPMRLPLLGELDPRAEFSPVWSIQNIQFSRNFGHKVEVYVGVKNLLNYTPPANSIARSFDPFDKNVQFDEQGQVVPTTQNPYALTFDPSYVFAPNQGIRGFLGFRVTLK